MEETRLLGAGMCFGGAADVKEERVERVRKASAAVDQRESGRGDEDVEWGTIVTSGGWLYMKGKIGE